MFVDIPAGYQGTISPKWFRFLVALLVILIIVLAVLVYRNRYPSVSSTGSVSVSSGPDTDAERRASEIRKQLDGIAKRDAGRPTPAPTAADIQAQLDGIAKRDAGRPTPAPTAADIQAQLDTIAKGSN